MATNTLNYNIVKPDLEDLADITVINENMDIIDTQLKVVNTRVDLQNTLYTTTGTANTYAITINGITNYSQLIGIPLLVKINVDSTSTSTLNVNGLGAKGLKKPNGNSVTYFKSSGLYTVVFDGTNFILPCEGGDIPKITNNCRNGSFENDTNCFTLSGGVNPTIVTTGAYTGSKCLKTTSSPSSPSYVYQDNVYAPDTHKIYVTAMVNVESYTSGEKASIALYKNNSFDKIVGVYADTTIIGTWQRLSFIATSNSDNTRLLVGRGNLGIESTKIDAVMIIDLTATFGAGKEPIKEEMDYIVSQNSNWWDSDLQALTLDATATAADIISNKTAFVNGKILTGTNTNKKWATGSATISGAATTFTKYNGSGISSYYCSVTHNLGWQPSKIEVYSTDNNIFTLYDANASRTLAANLPNDSAYGYQNSGNLYNTVNAFQLPINSNAGTYSWIAYE